MLGVRGTECDREVSIVNCAIGSFRKGSNFYSNIIPIIVMLITYATYTVIMKEELSGT